MDRKTPRYAHSAGHTDLCYSEDGKKLITCGTDGDIRIWAGFEDYDPVQTCVGEWSLCVRQKNKHIQIGTDNNNVQLLTYPNGERDGILTRFTAHVNHIAVGKNHNLIALAAEDMEVKIINLTESKENSTHLSFLGLSGPPLSVAICPKAKYLCVSSGDGYLRFWDIERQALIKDFDVVPKTNSFMNAKILCRMDFDPKDGRYLAYPDKNAIIILNVEDWSTYKKLESDSITALFSIIQFSPCGNFLAACTDQGDIVIWEIITETLVNVSSNPSPMAICAMMWNPSGNGEIAYCDVQGQLAIVTNCITFTNIPPSDYRTEENDVDFGDVQFEDDDDEDDENVVSLEKLKNSIMAPEPELEFDKESSAPSSRPRTPVVPMQLPFIPSSTPEHLNPRYLCWNEVGIVRSYGSEDDSKSIEVDFHDSNFHNSMMMQNFQNYTMASLSVAALAVANASQITIISLNPSIKEWTLNIDEEKEITCIAASSKLICFATSNYLVHICTVYGTQKSVICIPGPIVSMSAYEDILLVAYHASAPRKDDQCIHMMLVRFEGMSVLNKTFPSALAPESNLFWLGFSDVGTPASLDSTGMLYLFPLSSNIWLPFCDTTKQRNGISDGFFVTAVFETTQSIRGIRCKGSNYPGFIPRPTLSELPLEPPFVEMSTEKSQMEANLYTWRLLQVENMDKKFMETGLKTFVLACKNGLEQRALELVDMLENEQILTLALKYATKLDKRRLAEKLMELTSNSDWNSSVNSEIPTPSSTPKTIIRPNRKLILNSNLKSTPKNKSFQSTDLKKMEDTPSNKEQDVSTPTSLNVSKVDTTVNTQESVFTEEEPKNPFLKSLKKSTPSVHNPLSLTDKFAGFNVGKKENKPINEGTDKRKRPDNSDTEKQKEKQRKLDKFMFSKQN